MKFPPSLEREFGPYASKQKMTEKLEAHFARNLDYMVFRQIPENHAQGGRPTHKHLLTVDCFKELAMMAGTARGKEIRQYFLECERKPSPVISTELEVVEHDHKLVVDSRFVA